MKINFLSSIILGLSICLLFGCQKELVLDVAGTGTKAVFKITRSATGCDNITVNGNLLDAIALTANETLTIEVNVTTAGKWTLASNTINGFYYAGAGTFPNTGIQVIELAGNGTPLSTGNYWFTLTDALATPFLTYVLKHDVTEESVGTTSYFKATIDGVEFNFNASLPGADDIPYGVANADTASFSSFLVGGTYPNIPGPGVVSLQKNYLYHYYGSTEADFKNFFTTGAYPVEAPGLCTATGSLLSGAKSGIYLFWAPTGGSIFSTIHGSANQEGSSFTIVGIEDGHNAKGNYFVKVKSRFNCNLYNTDNGASMVLSNGEMVSYFIKPL